MFWQDFLVVLCYNIFENLIFNTTIGGFKLSKLYNTYLKLKKTNEETIYLFKNGIFFIALDDDAYTLSKIFNFKLTNLTDTVVKCGFPCASFNKYSKLFLLHHLKIKIIELDNKVIYQFKDYVLNIKITELLNDIKSIDINTLSIQEAYQFIENLKNKVNKINNEDII